MPDLSHLTIDELEDIISNETDHRLIDEALDEIAYREQDNS